jgi:hypothetical protein
MRGISSGLDTWWKNAGKLPFRALMEERITEIYQAIPAIEDALILQRVGDAVT